MNYLMTLTELMKTSFKRSWQLLIILHTVKTNTLRGYTSQNWFDAEITEKISDTDTLFKELKKSCLHVDNDNYKEMRNVVQKLIHTKKKAYAERKLRTLGSLKNYGIA